MLIHVCNTCVLMFAFCFMLVRSCMFYSVYFVLFCLYKTSVKCHWLWGWLYIKETKYDLFSILNYNSFWISCLCKSPVYFVSHRRNFLLLWWILECDSKSTNVFAGRILITARTGTVNQWHISLLICLAAVQLHYLTYSKNSWKMEKGTPVPSWCVTEVVRSTGLLWCL